MPGGGLAEFALKLLMTEVVRQGTRRIITRSRGKKGRRNGLRKRRGRRLPGLGTGGRRYASGIGPVLIKDEPELVILSPTYPLRPEVYLGVTHVTENNTDTRATRTEQ